MNKNEKIPSDGAFSEIVEVASAKTAEASELIENYIEGFDESLLAPGSLDVASWAATKFYESLVGVRVDLRHAMTDLERAGVFARGSVDLKPRELS